MGSTVSHFILITAYDVSSIILTLKVRKLISLRLGYLVKVTSLSVPELKFKSRAA